MSNIESVYYVASSFYLGDAGGFWCEVVFEFVCSMNKSQFGVRYIGFDVLVQFFFLYGVR